MNLAKKILFLGTMTALTFSVSALSHAEEAEAGTVLQVNGVSIPQSAVEAMLKERGVPANQLKILNYKKALKII